MAPFETAIEVHKRATARYDALLHRGDGVRVALEGGSYNRIGGIPGRVPHDVAHFVVEGWFGLHRGLWGVLAAGGLVRNAAIVGGRRPPHALRRARAVTDAALEELGQAEVLVRATADLMLARAPTTAEALRAAAGERWAPASITTDAVTRACGELRRRAAEWEALAPGESLPLTWRGDPGAPARPSFGRRTRRTAT